MDDTLRKKALAQIQALVSVLADRSGMKHLTTGRMQIFKESAAGLVSASTPEKIESEETEKEQ